MGVIAFVDGYVNINSNVISDHVKKVTLEVDAADLDTTAMGATWMTHLGGIKSGKLSIDIEDDYAAGNLDSILWPLFGTVVTFEIRPTSAGRGTSNPAYTGSILLNQLIPISGKVGDLAEQSVTWPTSGTVTRATS